MLGKTPALLSCAGEAREVAIDELDWTWRMLADLAIGQYINHDI